METLSDEIELLKKLVRNGGVTEEKEKVNRSQEDMAEFLRAHGVPHLTFEEVDGRRLLFASNRPGKSVELLFNVHLDVVPPSEEGQFEPRVEGDWLYGRGSEDDLGNAVAVAAALVRLKDSPVGVGAIFTGNEEQGGSTTGEMVRRGYAPTKCAIVLDGHACTLVARQKGIQIVKLTAKGRSCHASRPWDGENAIDILLDGYAKLREGYRAWPQAGVDDVWHITMAACEMQAGSADNQVPGEASMIVNFRYTAPEEREKILAFVRETSGLEVTEMRDCQPVVCDAAHPVMQMFREELQKCFPDQEVKFADMCGATDARYMVGWHVPIAITGIPGGPAHGAGERASLDGIRRYTEWLVAVAGRLQA